LGACIQCTKGKCVRSYHVTCAYLSGVHVQLDDNGVLESFCYQHDPFWINQKKDEQKKEIAQIGAETFKESTLVVCRWGSMTYEGIVTESQPEQRGCMVQFEEQYEFPTN
jgi:hypothetical protein